MLKRFGMNLCSGCSFKQHDHNGTSSIPSPVVPCLVYFQPRVKYHQVAYHALSIPPRFPKMISILNGALIPSCIELRRRGKTQFNNVFRLLQNINDEQNNWGNNSKLFVPKHKQIRGLLLLTSFLFMFWYKDFWIIILIMLLIVYILVKLKRLTSECFYQLIIIVTQLLFFYYYHLSDTYCCELIIFQLIIGSKTCSNVI